MNNSFNKKLSEIFGKMDEKVLQAKLNAAIEMLEKGNTEELAKKLSKTDKEEFLSKINEIDDTKLQALNLNKEDLKQKISEADLQKLSQLIGDHGDEIINKIKDILK